VTPFAPGAVNSADDDSSKASVECAGVERANGRQSSWSSEGDPQLTIIGQLAELISNDRKPACALALSEGAVRVTVHRLRERYRELFRQEIADTLQAGEAVEAEMRHLFAVLRND
jgi:hypothetical protein